VRYVQGRGSRRRRGRGQGWRDLSPPDDRCDHCAWYSADPDRCQTLARRQTRRLAETSAATNHIMSIRILRILGFQVFTNHELYFKAASEY